MIKQLLHIKQIRVELAEQALNRAKSLVIKRENALSKSKNDLIEHIQFRKSEEDRMFQEVLGKHISLKLIESIKEKVASLKHQDVDFKEKIEVAKKDLRDAKQQVQDRHFDLINAEKSEQKYETLDEKISSEEVIKQQVAEDNELDEFKVKILQ